MTNETNASSGWQSKRSTIGRLAVIVVVGLPLIGFIFVCQSRNSAFTDELNAVRTRTEAAVDQLTETNELRQKLDQSAEVYKLQTKRISSILKSCRQLEDLWENHSLMCVSTTTDRTEPNDSLRLLLPSGNHELVVRMKKIDPKSKEELVDKELRYPLSAGSYFIDLDIPKEKDATRRDPRELFLRITSSSTDFRPIAEKLLDDRFPPPSGAAWSGSRPVAFFPNQIDRLPMVAEKGVLVNKMQWRLGTREQPTFDLNFEMRLESDSPKVVNSLDKKFFPVKIKLNLFPTKTKLNYLGDGRYEILPPQED